MTLDSHARSHVDSFRWHDSQADYGDGPIGEQEATLRDMAALRRAVDEMIAATVRDMRTYGSHVGSGSWRRIGQSLGVSMQAAQQRYGQTRSQRPQ